MITGTFDLGTTALKFVVIDDKSRVLYSAKKDIQTLVSERPDDVPFIEQDPASWYEAFCGLLRAYDGTDRIDAVICSGQMQDVICLDKNCRPLCNAILYNDQRAQAEASYVRDESLMGADLAERTTVSYDGSIPLPKLYWLKKHNPALFSSLAKVVFSAKDYLMARLTDQAVSDVVTLATTGMMDIRRKTYVSCPDIPESILPRICWCDEVAGQVTAAAAAETGLRQGIPVYAGSGDAGATTLASGICAPGELNINLGTSGWIAGISDEPQPGVFNLCAINRGKYINVVPVLNAGNVHKWIYNLVYGGREGSYDDLDKLIAGAADIGRREAASAGAASALLCLPYLSGERFPVADGQVRGCFIGLTAETTLADMARSALEGVAFSLRQGLSRLGITPVKLSLIGGGAASPVWSSICASVFGTDVTVYGGSEYLPSIALASVVLVQQGILSSYESFIADVLTGSGTHVYHADSAESARYQELYRRFTQIYPAVRSLF